MKNKREVSLYEINKNVKCVKCGCTGAVRSYGTYCPGGIPGFDDMKAIAKKIYEKYENSPYMFSTIGFGGTIPYECLNCGNTGLIDAGGLEGYDKSFETISKEEEER